MEPNLSLVNADNNKQPEKTIPEASAFSISGFEHAQRIAKMIASSSLVPDTYKNNVQNTLIALELANRIGASPLLVMQNLYIVMGKPSWSSSFIIASLNACKRFSPIRFEVSGELGTDDYGYTAWAYDLQTKDRLEGPKITWSMVKAEGWLNKAGSKWKTMPELMFRYRAAAFFGRLYAPDILMGMHSADELEDTYSTVVPTEEVKKETADLAEKLKSKKISQSEIDLK